MNTRSIFLHVDQTSLDYKILISFVSNKKLSTAGSVVH